VLILLHEVSDGLASRRTIRGEALPYFFRTTPKGL
jgi:hypothetical protein